MVKNSQDALTRAYVTLKSLLTNIANIGSIETIYVHEYHTVLDKLKGFGIDVDEFRILDSEIRPALRSLNTLTGERRYSEKKYVSKPYFLTKLDAILGYFGIITSEKPRRIGFSKPENR